MVFAALTEERQLRAYNLRPDSNADVDIAMATAARVVRGCFLENTVNGGQYHWTARDTADRQVPGMAMETIPQTAGNTGATWNVTTHSIRVATKGVHVFPVLNGATSVVPDTALYVENVLGDGNILTSVVGQVIVARTICACRIDGELDPLSTTYVWADFDPKKY